MLANIHTSTHLLNKCLFRAHNMPGILLGTHIQRLKSKMDYINQAFSFYSKGSESPFTIAQEGKCVGLCLCYSRIQAPALRLT